MDIKVLMENDIACVYKPAGSCRCHHMMNQYITALMVLEHSMPTNRYLLLDSGTAGYLTRRIYAMYAVWSV